ncbi:MAG: hypothetical protein AM326_10970 [Candidatus Thorarchaeota archaeon SMTZ-45]|nr:MAG: hypothetical protein AM326_10970 [Candidatus Thorarchaeota archaeon SMTZ-45]
MWRSTFNKIFPFLPSLLSLSFAGEGGNGGEGGAGGDLQQQLTQATEALGKLQGEVENLKAAKVDLERRLDEADKELLSETYLDYKDKVVKGGGKATPAPAGAEIDYNNASPAEIAAHISGKSKSELDKAIKEMAGRIDQTEQAIGKAFAQVDVALAALRHPDFDPNKDAIYKIAKANPTWGAEKCYEQWKMESTAAATAKAEADKKKAEDDRKALTEKGEGVPEGATQGKELTAEEAGNVAFDKAFGTSEKA